MTFCERCGFTTDGPLCSHTAEEQRTPVSPEYAEAVRRFIAKVCDTPALQEKYMNDAEFHASVYEAAVRLSVSLPETTEREEES